MYVIKAYVLFYVWLLLFIIMFVGFVYSGACGGSIHFHSLIVFHCVTIPSFFHYTADGDLDYFRFLATIIVLLLTFLQLYFGEHTHSSSAVTYVAVFDKVSNINLPTYSPHVYFFLAGRR